MTARGKVLLWLATLAGGAAWLGDDDNARLAAAMLATPLVVDFVAKQRRLQDTSIRVAPRRTQAGAVFVESVQVEHRGRSPLRGCRLAESRTMRGSPRVLLPTLSPFAPARFEIRQRSLVRSHLLERVFDLRTQWPLGMFETQAIVTAEADLITEPAREPVPQSTIDAAFEAESAPRERSMLPGPEFAALREHHLDEDARGVHALRSAALGTLVRRVTRGRTPRDVGVVLDLRRPPGQGQGRGLRRAERCLGACADLVEQLHRRGAAARVLVIASEPERVEVRGQAQLNDLLTLLAEASLAQHHPIASEHLAEFATMEHCFWIAAGGYFRGPDQHGLAGKVTLLGKEFS
ncbi:MAG: DUF58 domain-containing protein [Planctomycetota bacterium]